MIATKFGLVSHANGGFGVVDSGPANVRVVVEGSLQRLGTDHIDLYYQHPSTEARRSRTPGKCQRDVQADGDSCMGVGHPMADRVFTAFAAEDQNWDIVDAVRAVAKERGVSPTQVALSWVANRPGVTAPVIGARTVDQLEKNLVAGDLKLGDEATTLLDEVSAPKPDDYPYGPFG